MDKLAPADYKNMIPYIDKTACGAVYPLSIAESTQPGNIYTDGGSALFWHYSGFAFLYGVCDSHFLNRVYENFFRADRVTLERFGASPGVDRVTSGRFGVRSKRFILFATNEQTRQFFSRKDNAAAGKRYFFEYPNGFLSGNGILPANFAIHEINGELFAQTEGIVTPRFSWADLSEFVNKGKGYCVTDGQRAVSWAFSAAVSTDEIDIGIETRAEYRHLGLGTIAAQRMIQYCLEQGKRPVWACNAGNILSQRLAEKLGFLKVSECDTFSIRPLS